MVRKLGVVLLSVLLGTAFLPVQAGADEVRASDVEVSSLKPAQKPEPVKGYDYLERQIEFPNVVTSASWEGYLTLRAYIDTNGNVERVRVVDSMGDGFDTDVVNALKQVRWRPASQGSHEVPVWMDLTIRFEGGEYAVAGR